MQNGRAESHERHPYPRSLSKNLTPSKYGVVGGVARSWMWPGVRCGGTCRQTRLVCIANPSGHMCIMANSDLWSPECLTS
jgi:hypothetical protein